MVLKENLSTTFLNNVIAVELVAVYSSWIKKFMHWLLAALIL